MLTESVSGGPRTVSLHEAKVEAIARQLRQRKGTGPASFKKKSPPHSVPKRFDSRRRDEKVDLGDLDAILDIDPVGMTCTAEPAATFDAVVRATLPHGLVPFIVPEHKTITLGGAIAGCSIESMSFRQGGFHDTCLEYEVITAKGDVLRCSPKEEPLLFQMMHGSFGTLGILSKVRFKLTRAAPYVRVTNETHSTLESFQQGIWHHFQEPGADYLDGQIFSPTKHVLCVGHFVDRAPYVSRYEWLTAYCETIPRRSEDYLTTYDYLFRYNRGVTHARPQNLLARALFGKFIHSDSVLRTANRFTQLLPKKDPPVIVDVFIPFSRSADFMDWYHREMRHYPVWCVPFRRTRDYEWLTPQWWAGMNDPLFLDLAVYGMPQPPGRNVYKELEDELQRVNGTKTLISYNYYDEATFWSIWNRETYQAVKQRTDPDNLFRDLYVKTCKAALGL
ncbi:FAD-binding oxidoreductase [Corallococcus exiguus]|uniref:FAD-binding oxidoreductase n=1 Tax=Corallococcus TaxID=83461 RepID=UPI000EA0A61A|nr:MULTISPECIES: FAD-binding oxidoreductase [Corallococcus]NRD60273.1 FAD-binding oxidoreductase [Corallococcus exiguus]RKH24403.1 FAD-binding oxidoreductase [Corallococcus sp. CA041A]RUO94569.1 FAD-binding oxidoreductase [Corallococcus sp. AB018]